MQTPQLFANWPMPRALALLLTAAFAHAAAAQLNNQSASYGWTRMESGGGGCATGIAFSTSVPDRLYVRTDVCAPHRFDPNSNRWVYLGDRFQPEFFSATRPGSDQGMNGSNGIVVNPKDDNIVLATFGDADNSDDNSGGVYRSIDKGTNWTQVLAVPVNANKLEDKRHDNPLAYDPDDANTVYAGTQGSGLYRSTSGGATGTWSRVSGIATTAKVLGVAVDPSSTLVSGRRSVVYASVYGSGIYRSTDGGVSFALLPGSPARSARLIAGNDVTVYVAAEVDGNSSGGGIWRFRGGTWTEITPSGFKNQSFRSVTVNPYNASQLIAALANDMFRSTDGGASWVKVNNGSMTQPAGFTLTADGATVHSPWREASNVYFDPHHDGTVYLADIFMVWKTTNAYTSPVSWTPLYRGLNNSIPFSMTAPPQAASGKVDLLYAGGADYKNYRYNSLTQLPAANLTSSSVSGVYNGYLTGVDYCEKSPTVLWVATNDYAADGRVLRKDANVSNWGFNQDLPFSRPYPLDTQVGGPKIAASATDPLRAVYVAGNNLAAKYTADGGTTWATCGGLPTGALSINYAYDFNKPVAADRVNGNLFYCYFSQNSGELYRTQNGGGTWTKSNTSLPAMGSVGVTIYDYMVNVVAAPSHEGRVWVSLGTNGVWKSTDSGVSFEKIPYFSITKCVDFGKEAPGSTVPTAYVYGKEASTGTWGIYRSLDWGVTWQLITPADQPMETLGVMAADRKEYGRVFMGAATSGIAVGQLTTPAAAKDDVVTVTAPATVSPGQQLNVSVSYAATTARDIRVVLQPETAPYTDYGSGVVRVAAGSGTVNVPIKVSSIIPLASQVYQFQTYLTTAGGGWDARLDYLLKRDVSAEAAATTTLTNIYTEGFATNWTDQSSNGTATPADPLAKTGSQAFKFNFNANGVACFRATAGMSGANFVGLEFWARTYTGTASVSMSASYNDDFANKSAGKSISVTTTYQKFTITKAELGNFDLYKRFFAQAPTGTSVYFDDVKLIYAVPAAASRTAETTAATATAEFTTLYPNPASATVRLPVGTWQRLTIVDARGMLCLKAVSKAGGTLDVTNLDEGMYHVTILTIDGQTLHRRLQVKH
jgi:xyloglucan-specific exo-beta-1,4-glucanase